MRELDNRLSTISIRFRLSEIIFWIIQLAGTTQHVLVFPEGRGNSKKLELSGELPKVSGVKPQNPFTLRPYIGDVYPTNVVHNLPQPKRTQWPNRYSESTSNETQICLIWYERYTYGTRNDHAYSEISKNTRQNIVNVD